MKINTKAFTLIELLAVIVILAIIALIATPIVLNIIKDSKENTIKISAENYLSALDNSIALNKEKIKNNTYDIIDKGNICLEYDSTNCINELKLKVEGTIPESGTITIEKGIVVSYELVYREKIIKKESNGKKIIEDNPYKEVIDDYPGIICGEGEKEDLNLEVCHIRSIEDLVAFSNKVSSGNSFEGKTIELVNSLDFKSKYSYKERKVNNRLITGEGFSPIGYSYSRHFKGTFEGNNNKIKNLYINKPDSGIGALFVYIENAIIQNLTIERANVIGTSNSGILVGYNDGGTIQNVNLSNTNFETPNNGRHVGSLVGNNQSGTIKNIKAKNIKMSGGEYYETGGLIGQNISGTIENITLDNISMVNEVYSASGIIGMNEGNIKNIKARNININAHYYAGGLIGSNKGTAQDVELENIIINSGQYSAGLAGTSSEGVTIKNINMNNIKITGKGMWHGGLVGANSSDIFNVIGNNVVIIGKNRYSGGLVGSHYSGTVSQIKIKNVEVNAEDRSGVLAGSIDNGILKNSVVGGNIIGSVYVGIITGWCNVCSIDTVVVKGNVEGTGSNIGGLVGSVGSTSEANADISGVYLSGNLKFTDNATNNRMIGNKGSYSPVFKTLASSNTTINENKVESADISSVDGKTLINMGKASQSEYEAIGFEFESTDTNECYWYFDENDELDLKIK